MGLFSFMTFSRPPNLLLPVLLLRQRRRRRRRRRRLRRIRVFRRVGSEIVITCTITTTATTSSSSSGTKSKRSFLYFCCLARFVSWPSNNFFPLKWNRDQVSRRILHLQVPVQRQVDRESLHRPFVRILKKKLIKRSIRPSPKGCKSKRTTSTSSSTFSNFLFCFYFPI